MTILEALILGLVEGLTEYLPVSSTGHLIIAQYLLGMKESVALDAYSVCIQVGAIMAVLNLYFARIREMWSGIFGKNPVGRRLVYNLLLGFMPAMVITIPRIAITTRSSTRVNPFFIQWTVFFIFIANAAREIPSLFIAVF